MIHFWGFNLQHISGFHIGDFKSHPLDNSLTLSVKTTCELLLTIFPGVNQHVGCMASL